MRQSYAFKLLDAMALCVGFDVGQLFAGYLYWGWLFKCFLTQYHPQVYPFTC